MASYRCYILDTEDHIVQAHDLECDSDAHAEVAAERLLVRDQYHRFVEVWKSTRRVVKLERDPALRPVMARRVLRPARPLGSVI
ncbi:MAG: hypothetical protein WDN25_08140 [Acetobacteraceae bacterium]